MSIKLKTLLEQGKVAFGSWITIPHTDVSEMLSLAGFDWLLFDLEHSPYEVYHLEMMISSVKNDVSCLARVPDNQQFLIKRALDTGIDGVMVPLVSSKEDAILAVKSARYPPNGIRGVGPRRASFYGLKREEYFDRADEIMVIIQIETRKAVNNIEEILSVDGVSAFFIGPNDLSFSLGYRNWRNDEVKDTIRRLAKIGRKLGVPGGMYCSSTELLQFALENELQLLALGSDYRFLMKGALLTLEKARELI